MPHPENRRALASHLPPLHRRWFRACSGATAALLALHAIYWLPPVPLPIAVTTALGFVLFVELYVSMLLGGIAAVLLLLGAIAFVAVRVLGRFWSRVRWRGGAWLDSEDGSRRWAFSPWIHSAVWTALLCGHLGLDIDPTLTIVCLSGVLLLLPWPWALLGRAWPALERSRAARSAVWVLVFLGWWQLASDGAIAAAIVIWSLALLVNTRVLGPRLVLRDRFAFAVLCIPAVQLVGAMLPLALSEHGGTPLGSGMAYSFCEYPEEDRFFAAVPRCSPDQTGRCRAFGSVDEFDSNTFEQLGRHRFFSFDYAGRLEQLACLPGRVLVGMDWTVYHDEGLVQSLLAFSPDDPAQFEPNSLGEAAGDGIAYDARRRTVYYRSDEHGVIRRPLGGGEIERDLAERAGTGLASATDIAVHAGRDSLLLLGFLGSAIEIGLEDFRVRSRYPILNAWEFTVDEELDRIYVAGNWGFEAVDLETGRTLRRARIGLGGRRPALDRRNGLIYVPSTAGGRIQVFDRETLRSLRAIPVGMGSRYPFVSHEHGFLLATSADMHYRWNADDLAERIRSGRPLAAGPKPDERATDTEP